MVALTRHCLRAVLLGVSVVLALALGAALVRLLPWLLSPDVPWVVALPFARALFGVALEAAFLVGVPAGCALGTALLVERGEARALHCLGVSPGGVTLRAAPMVLACSLLAALVTITSEDDRDRPGSFARSLVVRGKSGCEVGHAHSISVPIVGVTWLCFRDARPRVVGIVPNSGGRAWFSAGAITVADDFARFDASDVFVGVPRGDAKFGLGLRVGEAHVSGLPRWGKSSPLSVLESGVVIGLALLGMSLGAVFVVNRLGLTQPVLAAGAAGIAGVLSLRVLHTTPAETDPWLAAAEVLGVGLAVSLAPLLAVPGWRGLLRAYAARKRSRIA